MYILCSLSPINRLSLQVSTSRYCINQVIDVIGALMTAGYIYVSTVTDRTAVSKSKSYGADKLQVFLADRYKEIRMSRELIKHR